MDTKESAPGVEATPDTAKIAQAYLDRGWCVWPVSPRSKVPPKGWEWNSREIPTIKEWTPEYVELAWGKHPNWWIGVLTGYRSGGRLTNRAKGTGTGGLVVADVDTYRGATVPEDLPTETLTAVTPRGGVHLFYRVPAGRKGRQANPWRPGIDLRGEGGLVVVAPSKGRRWVDGSVPLVEAPECLLQPRRKQKTWARIAPLGVEPRWWEAQVLKEACERVADASVGSRNSTLYGAAKDALRDCRHMGTEEVCVAMHHAGVGAGLPATEVQATILSALNSWA